MTSFSIVDHGDLVPQKYMAYSSFPSLAKAPTNGDILLLYRQSYYNEDDTRKGMKAHGLDGVLLLKRLNTKTNIWSSPQLLYEAKDYEPNLIDGFLTVLQNQIHLVFRRYPTIPSLYYTHGNTMDTLAEPQGMAIDEAFQGSLGYAQWGRLIQTDPNKPLLQCIYGQTEKAENIHPRVRRPGLFASSDKGKSWEFISWIAPTVIETLPTADNEKAENDESDSRNNGHVSANETALHVIEQRLYALMRVDGIYPGPLYLNYSDDEGHTWSTPETTGLYGEAPLWYTLPNGTTLVVFRGYNQASPNQGGTICLATFDPSTQTFSPPFVVDTYAGNHYDGGYSDMVWLDQQQQLLVVYYYSDQATPRNPWIRYTTVSL